MFKALFGRKDASRDAHALYGRVVARSRDPQFYTIFGVPDTFDGRFEVLVLHLFVLHARLKDEAQSARRISQMVFDNFLDDMDATLRELGVGDQTVPKRVTKMTRVFYGRTGAYENALAKPDEVEKLSALRDVLDRNFFPDGGGGNFPSKLATYMNDLVEKTGQQSVDGIISGQALFEGQPEKGTTL